MPIFNPGSQKGPPRRNWDSAKFIGMFVSTVVVGVILTLFAVYNASRELVLVREVDDMYRLLGERVGRTLPTSGSAGRPHADLRRLARYLTTQDHAVFAVPASGSYSVSLPALGTVDAHALEVSRLNAQGGYIEHGAAIITWTLVAVPGTSYRLLALHRHRPPSAAALFAVYRNRLIIPAAFFIWMTVWVSLILNRLVRGLRLQKDAVEHLAWYDPLTGLANRNLFFKALDRFVDDARQQGGAFSLAVLDLDRFKQVNDTWGHEAGDELLRQVAARLRELIRQGDLAARTGGDEFILLFAGVDAADCRPICERIVRTLESEYAMSDRSVRIGASLGIADFPNDAQAVVDLTRKADAAMYAAKRSGGGVVCYGNLVAETTSAGVDSGAIERGSG